MDERNRKAFAAALFASLAFAAHAHAATPANTVNTTTAAQQALAAVVRP
jgi:hypothetical protein